MSGQPATVRTVRHQTLLGTEKRAERRSDATDLSRCAGDPAPAGFLASHASLCSPRSRSWRLSPVEPPGCQSGAVTTARTVEGTAASRPGRSGPPPARKGLRARMNTGSGPRSRLLGNSGKNPFTGRGTEGNWPLDLRARSRFWSSTLMRTNESELLTRSANLATP
jgi:hypothetical protein